MYKHDLSIKMRFYITSDESNKYNDKLNRTLAMNGINKFGRATTLSTINSGERAALLGLLMIPLMICIVGSILSII